MIHPRDEVLMNFTGSRGSRCHDNSEELSVVRHHLRCLTFWRHTVSPVPSRPRGGGASKAEEGEEEVRRTRQPLGCQHRPNDGCQHCTQVKLKWLRWQKKKKEKKREVCLHMGRMHKAGKTLAFIAVLAQGSCWRFTNVLKNVIECNCVCVCVSKVAGCLGSLSANVRPKSRDLGVTLDHAMLFNKHIQTVTHSVFFHLKTFPNSDPN